MIGERYKEALQFAATVHAGHLRKGTQTAYLSHLLSVSALVMENGGSETEAIAGLLHDAIEDRGTGYKSASLEQPRDGRVALKRDIGRLFGADVLHIVEHCTDDEYLPTGPAATKGTLEEWKIRKAAYLAKLGHQTDRGALRVSCADKLHNARAILADYEVDGDALWDRFTAKSKDQTLWYYAALANTFATQAETLDDLGLRRLARQLQATVEAIERHEPK